MAPTSTNELKLINSLSFQNKNSKTMAQKLYTGIIFFQDAQTPRKYRNISNIENFAKFGLKLGAWYVNLYCKTSGKFDQRMYF